MWESPAEMTAADLKSEENGFWRNSVEPSLFFMYLAQKKTQRIFSIFLLGVLEAFEPKIAGKKGVILVWII